MELEPHLTTSAEKPKYQILIPGGYFCDIVFTGLPGFPALGTEIYGQQLHVVPGGGALITTIALHRLGINVGWLGKFGNDFFSRAVAERLSAEHVDLSQVIRLDIPLQRVTVSISYPEDRAFVSYVDTSSDSVDRVLEALDQIETGHVHFPGLSLDPRTPALLDACHARGITVSMDCQYRQETLAFPLMQEVVRRLDIFMPNESEALRVCETDDLDRALGRLSVLVPYLVIKQGGKGARSRVHGVDQVCPALPVEVVDTTGAGDVFNAGFLAAFLNGEAPLDCLRWGNYCGGQSVQGVGGTSTAPTHVQLSTWLAERMKEA